MGIKERILDYFLNEIINRSGTKFFDYIEGSTYIDIWGKCFEKTIKSFSLFEKGAAAEFSKIRGILRYCHASFDNNVEIVNVENLAIAIAMEMYSYNKAENVKYAYDLAESVLTNWVNVLKNRKYYRDKFSDKIDSINYKKNVNKIESTEEILKSRNDLYRAYFKSYSSISSSTEIRVYYPRPNENWIRWDKNYSIIINVNPMIGFELGFFKTGFDYRHIDNHEESILQTVYYLNSAKREGANFKSISVGESSGKIIWCH